MSDVEKRINDFHEYVLAIKKGDKRNASSYRTVAAQVEALCAKRKVDVTAAPDNLVEALQKDWTNRGLKEPTVRFYSTMARTYLRWIDQGMPVPANKKPAGVEAIETDTADTPPPLQPAPPPVIPTLPPVKAKAAPKFVDEDIDDDFDDEDEEDERDDEEPETSGEYGEVEEPRVPEVDPEPTINRSPPMRKPRVSVPPQPKLDKLVPSAERVKIYKRDELGKSTFIPREYTMQDLSRVRDIEEFVRRYLMPIWGAGDYEIKLFDEKGELKRENVVSIAADPTQRVGPSPVVVTPEKQDIGANTSSLLERMLSNLEKKYEATPPPPPPAPPPSLSAQVAELAQVKRVLFGEGGAEKKQTELEGLKMWFDFQHQQQQQQQQSGSKNEIDELRRELRGALDEIKRAAVPAPMPLPPPEPAVDVAMLVRTIAETAKPSYSLQDIVALTRQPQEPKTGFSEILQGIQTLAPVLKSMLGLDQMQMLAQQFQQQQSVASRGLRETLSDIQMLQRVVRDLAPKGGGDGESFWGVVNNLVSNLPESAAALGDLVAKIRGQNDVVEEETEEEPVQEPQFPPGLEKHLVALKKAGDDGGRVQKTITMLQFLGKKEPWRSHLVQLVRAAKEAKADASKKPVVLRILKDTLMNFVVANLLTTECVDSIIAAFEKNMDMILNFIATGKTS